MRKLAFGRAAPPCLAAALLAVVAFAALPLGFNFAASAQAQPADAEKQAFEAAKELGTVEAWDAFLANYPKGFHADLARAYVKKLAEQPAAGAAPPPASPAPAAAAPATKAQRDGAREAAPQLCRDNGGEWGDGQCWPKGHFSGQAKAKKNRTGMSCKELKARCSRTDRDDDCKRYLDSCTGHGDN